MWYYFSLLQQNKDLIEEGHSLFEIENILLYYLDYNMGLISLWDINQRPRIYFLEAEYFE